MGNSDCEVPQMTKNRITRSKKEKPPEKNPDFATIRIISQVVIFILKKCWLCCGTSIFVFFVINWYYSGIFAFIFLFFSLSALLYQASDWILYQPDQPSTSRFFVPSPSMYGLPCENIFIKTRDNVQINAILIKQDPSIFCYAPTIIYFHGNAGNIGHRIANLQGLYHHCGCNILIVEYRGYGRSNGIPNEEGLYIDAQSGLDYLLHHPTIDKSKIIVFGRSLGGAVAIDLASNEKYSQAIHVLVVENTFTNIPDIAKIIFNWRFVQWIPLWFYKNQFQSKEKICNIKIPTLFLSGLADTLIPPKMMRQLYENSGSKLKRIVTFENGTHNETWHCDGYYKAWNNYLVEVLQHTGSNGLPQGDVHIPMAHII